MAAWSWLWCRVETRFADVSRLRCVGSLPTKSMKSIWKFPFKFIDEQSLLVPDTATPVSVGLDPIGDPCVWCEVFDSVEGKIAEQPKKPFQIFVVGTGNPFPAGARTCLGRINHNNFVWHIYTT